MKDKILKALQKKYGNVTYYERIDSFNNSKEVYFNNVHIFKRPMVVFHLLRKTALLLDKMADFVRGIIHSNTEVKDMFKFK